VLTSNDPEYQTKLENVHGILASLKVDEGFFFVDEFGPFAIKQKDGRKLRLLGGLPPFLNGNIRKDLSS
jgi:hypothetical protein